MGLIFSKDDEETIELQCSDTPKKRIPIAPAIIPLPISIPRETKKKKASTFKSSPPMDIPKNSYSWGMVRPTCFNYLNKSSDEESSDSEIR